MEVDRACMVVAAATGIGPGKPEQALRAYQDDRRASPGRHSGESAVPGLAAQDPQTTQTTGAHLQNGA